MAKKPSRVDSAEYTWRIWEMLSAMLESGGPAPSTPDSLRVVMENDGTDVLGAVRFVDESGTAYGIKQVDNKPRISSMPYLYDIAKGNVPNHSAVRISGHNDDVGISIETVWHRGGLKSYLTSAERLQITSDDGDDDGAPAGNGANTVTIAGLDADYDPISETVTMNGVANVLTDASFLRVLKMTVVTAGATGYNEGTITASNNADTAVLEQIDTMENESHSASYTVPNGYTMYVAQLTSSESSLKGSEVNMWMRPYNGLWYIKRHDTLLDNNEVVRLALPNPVPAKTDIEARATAHAVGAIVSASIEGWIEI